MSSHRNMFKLVVVKKLIDSPISPNNILRLDLEPNNNGFLALLSDGRLVLTTWVKKKISTKVIPDASDGNWQCGGESEVIITCQNGSIVRYTLHFDTGLSCSLQLSAPSLLSLIREKESSIRSTRNLKVWGHSEQFILLQPQSDRLVLLATNAGGRPSTQGVLRTPPLRSAHLCHTAILAQPITGTDLYEYDVVKCKLLEVVSLGVQRAGAEYTEWGSLACSSTGDTIALADSERHLYLTNFRHRTPIGKKGGVIRSRVTLHQMIWPANLEPEYISELSFSLSDTTLALFCTTIHDMQETQHYLSFDVGVSSLNCHHIFSESAAIIPGTAHLLPDLFLTADGIAMLMDEDASINSMDSDVDLEELLGGMKEGLEEQNMAKVTEVKAMIEQGLSVFLASCNQVEGWVGLAGARAQQYGQLADLLLGYIPEYAQCHDSHSFALSLKFLATHHFSSILEDMNNVLKYVDDDNISQMILQMIEQVSFYLNSVEKLQLPQAGAKGTMTHLYEEWGDRPIKEIVEDALERRCLKFAESYLQLKPWVYGNVTSNIIVTTCIDIAREKEQSDSQLQVLMSVDESYREVLRQLLYSSDDQFEVWILAKALNNHLSHMEARAVQVVLAIHKTLPDLLTLPPARWVELVLLGDCSVSTISAPMTVSQVATWTSLTMMLILCDLYAYSADADIMLNIDGGVIWQYLLHQNDLKNLKRWIYVEFCPHEEEEEITWHDSGSRRGSQCEKEFDTRSKKSSASSTKFGRFSILNDPLYPSDVESSVKSHDSLDSSSIAASEMDNMSVRSFELFDSKECVWEKDLFQSITQDMIDLVVFSSRQFSEKVLNILSKCGVFTTREKNSADLLVRRLCISEAVEVFPQFTGDHTCQMSSSDIHELVLKFFVEQKLIMPAYDYIRKYSLDHIEGSVLERVSLPHWIRMIIPLISLHKSRNRQILYKTSVENLLVLSENCQKPKELLLPIFLTVLFDPGIKLVDFIKNECSTSSVSNMELKSVYSVLAKHHITPRQVLEKVAEQLPHLKLLYDDASVKPGLDVTLYDLLLGTVPFDLSRLFMFQSSNRHGYDEKAVIPTWSSNELISQYGVVHCLDFRYYLREGRPTYAAATLLTDLHSAASTKKKEEFHQSVYGMALSSWPDQTVSSACLATLLMTGMDVDHLRTVLSCAYLIYSVKTEWCSKLSQEKRKGHETLIKIEINRVLQQLCSLETRTEAALSLLEMLENCVILSVADNVLHTKGSHNELPNMALPLNNIVDIIGVVFHGSISEKIVHTLFEGMRLCVDLSHIYNLPWPVKLLSKLAESDQWLLYLVAAQIFSYPKLEVLKVAEYFRSRALRDHMIQALTHISYYRDTHVSRERKKAAINKRSSLYAKIGIQSRESSKSPVHSSDDDRPLSASPSEFELSVVDDVLSLTTSETVMDFGVDGWLTYEPKNLYSILLTCHQLENSAGELNIASVTLSSPILAVFSACYDRHSPIQCLAAWLYTQLSQNIKLSLHSQLSGINEKLDSEEIAHSRRNCCRSCDVLVMQSSHKEVKLFILSHLSDGSLDVVSEGLRIFGIYLPILNIILAIQEVKRNCTLEKVSNLLTESATVMGSEQRTGKDKTWLTILSLEIIATSLDKYITNGYQQYHFLLAIASVSQFPPFCSHSINWSLVSQICKIVGAAKHNVTFMELLWSFESGSLKETADQIVKCLSSRNFFSEALEICQLLDIPIYSIVCGQLRAKFEESKDLLNSYQFLDDFLMRCQKELEVKNIPPEQISELYMNFCKELPLSTGKYLCLQYALISAYKSSDLSHLSSHENFTIVCPAELQNLSEVEQVRGKIEYMMWQAKVEAYYNREVDYPQLRIEPPHVLGTWPWEDELSSLDLSRVLKLSVLDELFLYTECDEKCTSELKEKDEIGPCKKDNKVDPVQTLPSKMRTLLPKKEETDEEKRSERTEHQKLLKQSALQNTVNLCAEKGMLVTACRILRIFRESNKNIQSLLLLLGLADGTRMNKCSDENLSEASPHSPKSPNNYPALRERTVSRCTVNSSLSGFSMLSFEDLGTQIAPLVKAASGLTAGRKLAERILMLYKVATALDLSYLYLIHHHNPITLVSLLLRRRRGGVIQLAKDLIQALPIPQTALQNFLFEEAVATITSGPEGERNPPRERLLGWEDLEGSWMDLLGLCQDPSSLGHQLLEFGERLGSSYPDQAERVHRMSVELVIRAHDCFTAASNMEGIGTVLRTALTLTTSLLNHAQWPLMVRLLVGVGRYSEMSYIIDSLREHDQFEPLLGRGTVKWSGRTQGLDHALVHYLRSKYPQDTDTLRLVALHFLLYSEVAEMWACEAEALVEQILEATVDLAASCTTSPYLSSQSGTSTPVKGLGQRDPSSKSRKKSSLVKSPSFSSVFSDGDFEPQFLNNVDIKLLIQAMHSYTHAAQYYMQDQQFALAVEYSQQAELVALQIAHSKKNSTALRILKLTPAGVRYVTTQQLRVAEAQLVSRAYHISVDWGSALYHQYIKMGQDAYLSEYLSIFRLSPEVLLNVVNKLEHEGVTKERHARVGNLLPHVEEGEVVYRVGSQLGLRTSVDACLASPAAPYLKDTVFLHGCSDTSATLG